jgi:hypothetical protein
MCDLKLIDNVDLFETKGLKQRGQSKFSEDHWTTAQEINLTCFFVR